MPEAARRRKRREVAYQGPQPQSCRRPLSREQLQALQAAIDKGSNAEFGLVKLSQLQLDAPLFPPPDASWPLPSMTLLSYAAWKGRDAIAGALLRAGADAAARHEAGCAAPRDPEAGTKLPAAEAEAARQLACGSACSEAARACMSGTLPMHSVWLVRQLVLMRIAAEQQAVQQLVQQAVQQPVQQAVQGAAPLDGTASTQPEVSADVHEQRAPADVQGSTAADTEGGAAQRSACCRICRRGVRLPVAFLACHHVSCESCVWLRLKEGVVSGGAADLVCPCEETEGREGRERGSGGGGRCAREAGVGMGEGARPDEAARRRKRESLERWEQLPDAPPPSRQLRSTALEKPKFAARTAAEMARLYVGATRAQRQSNLWKAAEAGNVERLVALVDAGVHVEGVNEYGQTALYLSALHGREAAVRKLCAWAAADVEVRADGGSSCLSAAASNGHCGVVRALAEAGAELQAPGPGGWSAVLCAVAGGHEDVVELLRQLGGGGGEGGGERRGGDGCEACMGRAAGAAVSSCEAARPEAMPAGLGIGTHADSAVLPSCLTPKPGALGAKGLHGDEGVEPAGPTNSHVQQEEGESPSLGRCTCCCRPSVTCHIAESRAHPGAGSYSIDDALTADEVRRLTELWARLLQPVQRGAQGAAGSREPGASNRTPGASNSALAVSGRPESGATQCITARERCGSARHREPEDDDGSRGLEDTGVPVPHGTGSGGTAACNGTGSTTTGECLAAQASASTSSTSAVGAAAAAAAAAGAAVGGVERVYYYDAEGWVRQLIARLVRRAQLSGQMPAGVAGRALPGLRFLRYASEGASMAPHVDLAKQVPGGSGGGGGGRRQVSTHTFLLYLVGCGGGGSTLLLEREGPTVAASGEVLAAVQPRVGRLLLFPHKCPHAGAPVTSDGTAPLKLLLRGELY